MDMMEQAGTDELGGGQEVGLTDADGGLCGLTLPGVPKGDDLGFQINLPKCGTDGEKGRVRL